MRPVREAREVEAAMLARLGLHAGATRLEVESARQSIVRYLAEAPAGVAGWARRQEALIDEAYALLSDPTGGQADALALDPWSDGIGGLEARDATGARADVGIGDAAVPAPGSSGPAGGLGGAAGLRRRPLVRTLGAALALVGVLAVGYVVYAAGAPAVPGFSGTPAPEASAGIDMARVAQLMTKIQQDSTDVAALTELGDIFFTARDYATAATWMSKVLAVDPSNVNAMLGLGAAKFNQGDLAGAESQWRAVLAIAPANQEAYYDLGYVYLSSDPPDMAKVREMWDKVVQIDPSTDIAKTVQTHLASLAVASPAASAVVPGSTGAPGATGAIGTATGSSPSPVPTPASAATAAAPGQPASPGSGTR